jgi:hypothetical protein
LIPALASASATVLLVVALNLLTDADGGDLPRRHITAPATSTKASRNTSPGSQAARDIALEPGGLGLVTFGQTADDVVTALTARLGVPDEDNKQPCGKAAATSRWVRWADLSLRFSPDTFAGYIEGVHFPPGRKALDFATRPGLSPGDSTELLHALYGHSLRAHKVTQPGRAAATIVTIMTISKGQQLSGLIEHDGNADTVASIFAGELC